MNLTIEGKNYLMQVMEGQAPKLLRFYGTEGCCGVNVQVEIAEPTMQDTVQLVDGLTRSSDSYIKRCDNSCRGRRWTDGACITRL